METLTKVGKYDVIDVLGRGGMGVVYKAMDRGIGRLVAIKMMTVGFTENPDLLRRFYREAQSTGTLQHPNIVIVHELGDQDGNPYLVMEYLEGESLDKIISARRNLTLVQKLDILIQLCDALNYAHSKGVVHRDIKPANIVVLAAGGVKIVDFGIARIGGDALTRTGQIVGTINYMSPEQIGAQVVDGRSDIWAAGVVAYQLLTFALPFEAGDTASTLLKIINEDPPPLTAYMRDCPSELEDAILRAITKDRDDRYQTAEDFGLDMMRVREVLRREQVDQYIEQAKAALERAEYPKAKELLLEVLKVDTQNLTAKQLLQQAQQHLQKQQRSEQIRQLRSMGESAIEQKQFADALSYLEQALALDKTNAELRDLRDKVAQEKQKQDQLDEALRKAESAQQADDLERAESAISEALSIDANSTRAKSLHASLLRQMAERSRRDKLQTLLESAAKEISARRFTGALDLLKEAESLDPSAPELHALLKLASSGKEQENRRRELEAYVSAVEEAMGRDDYAGACEKADEALLKFSADPSLLKLRGLAEKQKLSAERKIFVEEQLAAARSLIEGGKSADSLKLLETALTKAPGETRLSSMLAVLRENVQREAVEERKQRYVKTAKEALREKRYEKAVAALEAATAEFGDSAEFGDLLQFARDEAAQAARRLQIQEVSDEAQHYLAEEDYEQAVTLLERTLNENPDEELRILLADARRRADDFNKRLESAVSRSQQLLDSHKPEDAVALLDAQPKSFSQSPVFREIVARAHEELEKTQQIQAAIQESRAAEARHDYAAATAAFQKCRSVVGESPELAKAVADMEARRATGAKSGVERAMRDARMLLLARQYSAALQALEPVVSLTAFVTAELKTQFDRLVDEIREGATAQAIQMVKSSVSDTLPGVANQTEVGGSYETGVDVSQTPAPSFSETQVAVSAPTFAASAPAAAGPAPAAVPSRPKAVPVEPRVVAPAPAHRKISPLMIAGAVVLVLVIALAAWYFGFRRGGPAAADSYVSINAIPWGTVKTATTVDGKLSITINQITPVRMALPAGEYKVVIAGPDGSERTQQISAAHDSPASSTVVFEAIDVDQIIRAH